MQPLPKSTLHDKRTRKRSTSERIVESAIALIAKQGYSSLTFGAISTALGISKGLVHYHFPSKETLAAAILEHIAYDYADNVSRKVQASDSTQKLISFITAVFDYALEYPAKLKALREIGGKAAPEIISDIKSSEEIILKRIELYARTESRFAQYSSSELRHIALILKGAMDAYIAAWYDSTSSTPRSPEAAAKIILRHIV